LYITIKEIMKETFSFRVSTVKYGRNCISGETFWVKASSRAEAIKLAKPRVKPGHQIESVKRPRAFNLELS
jgi:hypothetical protein